MCRPIAQGMIGGGYRGNRQKWFAMRFTGVDADIKLATRVSGIRRLGMGRVRAAARDDRALHATALSRRSRRVRRAFVATCPIAGAVSERTTGRAHGDQRASSPTCQRMVAYK